MEPLAPGRWENFADGPRHRTQLHPIDAAIAAIKARMKKSTAPTHEANHSNC
jgi:hypothetical protein